MNPVSGIKSQAQITCNGTVGRGPSGGGVAISNPVLLHVGMSYTLGRTSDQAHHGAWGSRKHQRHTSHPKELLFFLQRAPKAGRGVCYRLCISRAQYSSVIDRGRMLRSKNKIK